MMNSVRVVEGVTIANVGWLSKPWRIIETGETFDEAANREFIPIDEFRTSSDLYDAIFGKLTESAVKDATSYPEWEHFVNLYRQVHNSNDDLDRPYIRNMKREQLQLAIINMGALINAPKY